MQGIGPVIAHDARCPNGLSSSSRSWNVSWVHMAVSLRALVSDGVIRWHDTFEADGPHRFFRTWSYRKRLGTYCLARRMVSQLGLGSLACLEEMTSIIDHLALHCFP